MAYGDSVGPGYAEGTASSRLAARDLGRSATGSPSLVPYVQEVTHEITGTGDLVLNVTTAGTRQRLNASALKVRRAIITAHTNNRDAVVIGGSTVVAALGTAGAATRRGTPLFPNDTVSVDYDDLTNIWIDAVVSGDGVSVWYFT
jgi:hypothetical protein